MSDDIYYDLTLPSNVIGRITYRKPADQNVLEIYADGAYRGGTGEAIIGVLPAGFRPSKTTSVFGWAETNRVYVINDIIINTDGSIVVPAIPSAQIRGFAFFGVIRL